MPFEKRNVVEEKRTPDHEIKRRDEDWDKDAAAEFIVMANASTVGMKKRDEPTLRSTVTKRD